MKYLDEFRDPELAKKYIGLIKGITTKPWTIMEICGGQTHSLVKNGIIDVLPKEINMVHGPGCPVCVTPVHLIDKAVFLAKQENVILCSFGDMIRVPGSVMSLAKAKSEGASVKVVYSPLEAVTIAQKNPEKEVVFFAVGFETTAPANALSVIQADKMGVKNYSILTSHVLVPPAMEAILGAEDNKIQGFLAAGHVCTVMGYEEYFSIAKQYKTPMVVTGFEPLDLLQGIYMLVKQLEEGRIDVENQYSRIVKREGNVEAQKTIFEVFEIKDRDWRGVGTISNSGYEIKEKYSQYDADKKFAIKIEKAEENAECIAGEILKGNKKPFECIHFGKKCNPEHPLGAPMVSSEGACAAYYHFSSDVFELM
ncbi:MAG: hydrogenase formation protein HypD [Bacteroidota bacterium]